MQKTLQKTKVTDFVVCLNGDDFSKYKSHLANRFSTHQEVNFNLEPTSFPCLVTYCYSNGSNGQVVTFKHIIKNDLKLIINEM